MEVDRHSVEPQKKPEVNELNNRWKEVEIDSDLKKIINSEEILKLRKLHGYI